MNETLERVRKVDFARKVLKRSPSYVTKLAQEGRLVVDGDGLVMVAASLDLIAKTAGARDDVAARHAAKAGSDIPSPPGSDEVAPEGVSSARLTHLRESRAESEARRSAALADQEEMTAKTMRGELIAREDVEAAMRFLGAAMRSQLDVLPDQVAPLVTPLSVLDEVHALLQDACRNVLEQIGQAIARQREDLAKRGRA